ncbi:hypothetical protein WA026_017698 [Henosepilachna vigintioctopunctata]|uniref:Uncharacterized protein n=1 Tax=Henosepilachna vigintioctopunctata TaxID=420089 RepID=A0AAW1UBK6_9CUCU
MNQSKDKSVRMLATPSILNKTNPEIFSLRPRPGGMLVDFRRENWNQPDTSKAEGIDLQLNLYHSTSREYRLTSALEGSNWSIEESDASDESIIVPDPLRDCDLPREQLNWTVMYLKCIRDECGKLPPNAQGILNHMKHIFNNDLTQFEDKPMYVDESGRIYDETEVANMSKTEKVFVKVTHKVEEEPEEQETTQE